MPIYMGFIGFYYIIIWFLLVLVRFCCLFMYVFIVYSLFNIRALLYIHYLLYGFYCIFQANEDAMEKLKMAKQSHEQFVKKKDGLVL